MIAENRIIIFVKNPTPGNVKTRLMKKIGPETAADLYRCLAPDTLTAAKQAGYPLLVCVHPPECLDIVRGWLGADIMYGTQEGSDLGERMRNAFEKVFPSCSRAVLIGSDSPDLPPFLLHEAFEALSSPCGSVIGPARDGGYYLIGFSRQAYTPAAFDDIAWSTPNVFKSTMSALCRAGLDVHILPEWYDIDEYDDLKCLLDRHKATPRGRFMSIDFLRDRLNR